MAKFASTLAILLCYWANLHNCEWPNIEQIICHLVTLSLSFFPATYTLILTVSRPQYFLFSHLPSKKMLRKKILGSCSYGSHASHWKVTFITVPVAYTNTGILKLRVFMRCKNVKISFLFHLVSRFRQFAILYMLKTQIKFAK